MKKILICFVILLSLFASSCKKSDNKVTITIITDNNTSEIRVDKNYNINNIEKPVLLGFEFIGWSISNNITDLIDDNYLVSSDITLYSIFSKVFKEFTITIYNEDDIITRVVTEGSKYILDFSVNEYFTGLYLDESYNELYDSNYLIDKDLVLYAKYDYPHVCSEFEWVYPDGINCEKNVVIYHTCVECGEIAQAKKVYVDHDYESTITEPTCTEYGLNHTECKVCHKAMEYSIPPLNHKDVSVEINEPTCDTHGTKYETCMLCGHVEETLIEPLNHCDKEYVVLTKATSKRTGYKCLECVYCGARFKKIPYAANGYSDHGKLKVVGTDLVDEKGEKFQLIGLSTHGLQWFSRYVNFDTFDAIHNEFGNNVFRLSLYTSEGGYCTSTPEFKEYLYQKVCEGIRIATKLDMYVIVDWHMVGADDEKDRNPLYYRNESKEFFSRITKEFKDYGNILYEIMNEPCGNTTWSDCKNYANQVIPVIRENTDNIVLVGNPKWSSDLASVIYSPLTGYENIMYTYHFYAAGSYNMTSVTRAYSQGIPVFISEHGGMESSGDGAIDYNTIKRWYEILDERNISYVAWNISNSAGSASIIKHGSTTMTDFSDQYLKDWGIYYKTVTRAKAGLV